MGINFIPNTNSSSQPYYLGQCAARCTPSSNAVCAELGAIEAKNSLQVHPTDMVEKTTATKKVYEMSNVLSVYQETSEIFNVDYFNCYYGLNIHKRK